MDIKIYTILSKTQDHATSTLIQYKDQKILIDCGLSSEENFDKYDKYKHLLTGVDIILISSAELNYAGAQPFIVSKYNFTGKIFSTVPVKYMSSLNLHNFASNKLPFKKTNLGEIQSFYERCFVINDRIIELKFRQKIKDTVKGVSVKLECFEKGCSIGSCFWKIAIDKIKVGYFIEYNNKTEFHLSGFDLEQVIDIYKKFDILITSSYCFSNDKNLISRQDLQAKLERVIHTCLTEQSNAIIVSDTQTRIFEYMTVMESIISDTPLYKKQFTKNDSEKIINAKGDEDVSQVSHIPIKNITLFFPTSLDHYMEIMKSLTEYMSSSLIQNMYFEEEQELKLDFVIMGSVQDVINTKGVKILLTTYNDLFYGRYHDVLDKWNRSSNHQIFINNEKFISMNNSKDVSTDIMLAKNKYITRPTPLSEYYMKLLINSKKKTDSKEDKMDVEGEAKDTEQKTEEVQKDTVNTNDQVEKEEKKQDNEKKIEEENIVTTETGNKPNFPFNFNAAEDDDDESEPENVNQSQKKHSMYFFIIN